MKQSINIAKYLLCSVMVTFYNVVKFDTEAFFHNNSGASVCWYLPIMY